MRHGKKVNHLGRQKSHRDALLANLSVALITHKRINTTLAKAKALRVYVEPLLTKSKDDTTHNRRIVFSYLQDKEAVAELFREVSTKIADRPGGYLRIIKLGNRQGDNAEMAMIELVDFNTTLVKEAKKSAAKKRTRRGSTTATAKTKEVVETTGEKEVTEKGTDTGEVTPSAEKE
jgi:large subunit ribosomal protein L17